MIRNPPTLLPRAILLFLAASSSASLAVSLPRELGAQTQVSPGPRDPRVTPEVTPRGAFLRSVVVPGWGHVATGTYFRGGFYFASQSGSLWMLWKSAHRKAEARNLAGIERGIARDRLMAEGVTDAQEILLGVAADPRVQGWEDLLEARSQQVEDWAALSIFLVLLSAADAYVSAHLMDYPEPLSLRVVPRVDVGAVELGISMPVGRRP